MERQRYRGFTAVLLRALDREKARKDNDYATGDRIRDELIAEGVRMDDKSHTLETRTGLRASYALQNGIGFHEAQLMCLDREEARFDKNYDESDRLRSCLSEFGVTLEDKSKAFRMATGQTGSYDLRSVGSLQSALPPAPPAPGYGAPPYGGGPPAAYGGVPPGYGGVPPGYGGAPMPYAGGRAGGRGGGRDEGPRPSPAGGAARGTELAGGESHKFRGYFDVLNLALQREAVRKQKDYASSDRMRSALTELGAEVHDPMHTFKFKDLEGNYSLHQGVGLREIQYVALEREEARRDKLYSASDQLRKWLSSQGVTVDDKSHTFSTADGTQGSYDLASWEPAWGRDEPHAKRARMD